MALPSRARPEYSSDYGLYPDSATLPGATTIPETNIIQVTDPDNWVSEIRSVALGFHKAIVEVYDPSQTVTTPYNPSDGSGGESVTPILATLKCRIILVKTPHELTTEIRTGYIRTFNIEFDAVLFEGAINEGFQVKITWGGDNPALVNGKYIEVQDCSSSSLMALRLITCKRES